MIEAEGEVVKAIAEEGVNRQDAKPPSLLGKILGVFAVQKNSHINIQTGFEWPHASVGLVFDVGEIGMAAVEERA